MTCAPVTLSGDVADPRSVVISNGLARVTYPGGNSEGGELAQHRLEVFASDGWRAAMEPEHGDWSFFAAPLHRTATRVNVIARTADEVVVAWVFDHSLMAPGSNVGGCYLAGCGVPYRDPLGAILYDYTANPHAPRIRRVTWFKVIGMRRGEPGYHVGYHSDPPLAWGAWLEAKPREGSLGERELGLGLVAGVTWSSAGDIVRNPAAGGNVELKLLEQASGPWWFATVPAPRGTPIRVASFVSLEHPMHSLVAQFGPSEVGVPMVHFMNPRLGPDGRNERFQAFVGAVPYEPGPMASEPTEAIRAAVLAALPLPWRDGRG